jgi:PIN domain nuclease of toxin-antitoxin system
LRADEYEAHPLELLEEVAEKQEEVVVLKDGKPHWQARADAKQRAPQTIARVFVHVDRYSVLGDIMEPFDDEWDMHEVIVADTHAQSCGGVSPAQASSREPQAIPHSTLHRSSDPAAISCWEIANLTRRVAESRLRLSPWEPGSRQLVKHFPNVSLSTAHRRYRGSRRIARRSIRDPADRLIVATALHLGIPLVTTDARIRAAGVVETIW